MNCVFCDMDSEKIIDNNDLFVVILDGFPVTTGHTLIIPKRCTPTWFDLTSDELDSLNKLLSKHKLLLEQHDETITGFNIGMNCGEVAGQTVMHCHIHLIPRREDDMVDPKGGVRGVLPEKQKY